MADVVEKNDTPIVEKVAAEEVEAKKDKEVVDDAAKPAAENGNGNADSATAKENGDAVAVESTTETPKETSAEAEAAAPAEENGKDDEEESEATDSAPAEAVKRKIVDGESKVEESTAVATPEKKAKLDEPIKEDNQNGSEASEVAA